MSSNKNNITCPCGSGMTYSACCQLYHSGHTQPETAEKLMRARYSAFALAKVDFIFDTMREKALQHADKTETLAWSQKCEWLRLEVHGSEPMLSENTASVSFTAHFSEDGKQHAMNENSLFKQISGIWYYVGSVDAYEQIESKPKIKRNDPCPCGSGKKFKKCCYLKSVGQA